MPQAHILSKYFLRMLGIWRAFPNFRVYSIVHAFNNGNRKSSKFSITIKLHGKIVYVRQRVVALHSSGKDIR